MGYGIKIQSDNVGAKPFYDTDTDIGSIKQVLDYFTMVQGDVFVKNYAADIDISDVFIHQTSTANIVRDVVQYSISGQTITFDATDISAGITIPVLVML